MLPHLHIVIKVPLCGLKPSHSFIFFFFFSLSLSLSPLCFLTKKITFLSSTSSGLCQKQTGWILKAPRSAWSLLPVLPSLAGPRGPRNGSEGRRACVTGGAHPALMTGVGAGNKSPKGPFQWWASLILWQDRKGCTSFGPVAVSVFSPGQWEREGAMRRGTGSVCQAPGAARQGLRTWQPLVSLHLQGTF